MRLIPFKTPRQDLNALDDLLGRELGDHFLFIQSSTAGGEPGYSVVIRSAVDEESLERARRIVEAYAV